MSRNESIDNAYTICLGPVDRQMMDSTCVSSPVKNSCARRQVGKGHCARGDGVVERNGVREGGGGEDRPEGEPLY